MKQLCKLIFLFVVGGLLYAVIEILWRGYTHWTMAILGGMCFLVCGGLNEWLSWDTPLWIQSLICCLAITAAELVAGLILNVWLGLGIWDYSSLPFNLAGQICLGYSCLWYLLSIPAIMLDDWLRHWFFQEERPQYNLRFRKRRRK